MVNSEIDPLSIPMNTLFISSLNEMQVGGADPNEVNLV